MTLAPFSDRPSRLVDLRARFEAGDALALGDAIEALPPDDWSPLPAARLDLLATNAAAGAVVGTALGVDPADPLARRPIPAGAWPSARLVAGDFEWATIDVLDGRVRLHAVEIQIASAVCGGPVPAVFPFPPGTADAEPPPCVVEAAAPLDDGEAAGAEPEPLPEPLPGAMIGVARALAEAGRPMRAEQMRAVFAGAGLVLDEAGQTIVNAVDTLTGEERSGRAGRRPTLSALLITARAEYLCSIAPGATSVTLARTVGGWLATNHPDLEPLAPKSIERLCRRLLEAKS
jgi:hypothetical protein